MIRKLSYLTRATSRATVSVPRRAVSTVGSQFRQATGIIREIVAGPKSMLEKGVDIVCQDARRVAKAGVPGAIVATPLALITVAAVPFTVPGTLAMRFAQTAESNIGQIAAGIGGFLVGTSFVVYAYEIALLDHFLETYVLVGRASERADAKLDEEVAALHAATT